MDEPHNPAGEIPASHEKGKDAPPLTERDFRNEIYLRRKLTMVLYRLIPVWIAGSILWLIVAEDNGRGSYLRVIAWSAIIFPAFILFSWFMTWRCPRCDKHLGRNRFRASCPRCGLDLDKGYG
ncbi:MAG: hypothetical protein L6Q71_06585 [Planctomycetes bacterium]|nr:hypothetical protein [Planctomycetota bacterium]NUQ34452.1 hypothetical protein [Planctomycetaceae bacterium]